MADADVVSRARAAIEELLAAGGEPAWLARCCLASLAESLTLAEAFGVDDWRAAAALERDQMIRALKAQHFANETARSAAETISGRWRDFEVRIWPREQFEMTCPARHAGNPSEFYWKFLQAGHRAPGPESIRKILARG